MKLVQAKRDDLLNPLQTVSGIVERRHTLPILSNVMIERIGERVSLLATDLEIQVTTSFDAPHKKSEDCRITTSARKLQDILRALPEQAEITLELQQNRLQVKAAKSSFVLQTLPAEDFPRLTSTVDQATEIVLSQKALRSLLLLVQYAMAQQDIRYYLNGMLLVAEGTTLRAVATDGHRLAYAALEFKGKAKHQEIIIPRKAIQELVRLLATSDDEVQVIVSAAQVAFRFGATDLVTKVIDGKFPDYVRVIPSGYTKQFTLERNILQAALQRVAILSSEKFHGVRWTLSGEGQLRISCTNTQQEEASEELDISYKGEALDIGFNVTYILDALSNLGGDKVVCSFGDANSSMLITVPKDENFRYVVMPMRI